MAGSCSGKDSLMCESWSTGAAVQILPRLHKHPLWLLPRGRKGPGAALVPTTEQPEQLCRGRSRVAGERSNALTVFRAAGGGCTSLDEGLLPQHCCCCNENCKIKLIYETLPFPSCPPHVLIFVVSEASGMLGRLTTGIPPPHHTAFAQLLPVSSGLARVLLVGLL